ncbi:MAG: CehA/McbA family metallohydrolase [Coprothermobacterota bacterium]|nr:CehA/McbA family metallohydrolase [Coprothermobacterota bacterium]
MKHSSALLMLLLCAALLAAGGAAATPSPPLGKEEPQSMVLTIANGPISRQWGQISNLSPLPCGSVENDPPLLRPYVGLLHAHTSYSDGEGTPAQAFAYARDSAGLDFLALTDHGELLSDSEWADTYSQADTFTSTGAFAALAGFEWTDYSKGHICVLGSQDYASYLNWQTNTLGKFYTWLEQRPQALGIFAHPKPTNFDDFAFRSGVSAQMALLEVANVEKNFEPGFLTALSKGWRVAAVAAQDNHHPDWGDASGQIAGIWAPSLTPSALLEAIRARRTFSSDDRNLTLSLQLNGAWMGSTLHGWPGQPLHWRLEVVDPDPDEAIVQADLVSLGGSVLATTSSSGNLVWKVQTSNPGGNFWIFARVRQADGDLAYSSPIWLEAVEPPTLVVTPQAMTFATTWGESPEPQTLTLETIGESGVE